MAMFLIRRLLSVIPIIGIVALIVFGILFAAPGDVAAILAGDQASVADIEKTRELLGLNRPFWYQFGAWFWRVLHGDFGASLFTHQPVLEMIGDRLEPTLSLVLMTTGLSIVVAVPLGTVAAFRANSWIDRFITGASVINFSVPVFVAGYLLAFVFSSKLGWFPVQGYSPLSQGVLPWLKTITLPSLALSSGFIAITARITRSTMLEILQQEYIKTARSKGMGNLRLLFIHALRNAGIPVATVIGAGIAGLIGGAVVTETVFAIPGIGRMTTDAILRRDFPVIQGVVLVFSFAYVFINLSLDIVYRLIDPRIQY